MSQSIAPATAAGQPLDLYQVMRDLQADGRMLAADVERLLGAPRGREDSALHPLAYLARQEIGDPARNGRVHTMDSLAGWLAETAGQPFYRIDPLKIDVAAITGVMSFAFARRHQILAVEASADEIVIASAQPFACAWESGLRQVTRRPIRRVVASPVDIERYLVEFYTLARSISRAQAPGGIQPMSGLGNLEAMLDLGALKDPDANDQHIVNIVDWLLQYAFDQRASDIHVEPRREIARVRFRIDGILHSIYELPVQVGHAVVSRIKILGRLDVAEKRRPQDGRLKTRRPDASEVELRLSTLPTAFGEKLVMRIFDPEVLVRSFTDLGLTSEDHDRWRAMVGQSHGIVLVTGPTGSGKTTTLYSTLKLLASSEVNVCTIEDPIEMVESAFNQMQVHHHIGLDFASGVRSLLRQDPDIIMIGEIRDRETADMAVQAALTGHLVLSTLHTNDAPSALTRLLEIGLPAYLLKATVLGVMAQRLVRMLCPHCRAEQPLDTAAWEQLVSPWKVRAPQSMWMPVGCLECRNTGYLGRQGIYEVLPFTHSVQQLLGEDLELDRLRVQAMKEGMHTLRLSGARKVAAGHTTLEEVMRVAPAQS